jgi:uncharacterized glyoxalase superfamily protein PhnB
MRFSQGQSLTRRGRACPIVGSSGEKLRLEHGVSASRFFRLSQPRENESMGSEAAGVTLIPHLVVKSTEKSIDFYVKAFDAQVLMKMPSPDGKSIIFAAVMIGGSRLYLSDEFPQSHSKSTETLGGTPVTLTLEVPHADSVYNRAVSAGAKAAMPLQDMFWGQRYGQVVDPAGNIWAIAQNIEQVSSEEMMKRSKTAFSTPGEC